MQKTTLPSGRKRNNSIIKADVRLKMQLLIIRSSSSSSNNNNNSNNSCLNPTELIRADAQPKIAILSHLQFASKRKKTSTDDAFFTKKVIFLNLTKLINFK